MSQRTSRPDFEPVIASFRFGPSFRIFATLWWILGPVPLALVIVSVMRGRDPVDLYVFLFFWTLIGPISGLALWRSGIDITKRFVVIRRLRHALYFDRVSTKINIANGGSTPVAHITDRHGTRQSYAVTAMRRSSRKLREMATYVPVTFHGKDVEPLPDTQDPH